MRERLCRPNDWYYAHGDERPPKGELQKRLDIITGMEPPVTLLTAADMYIDLAMRDPAKCDQHLGASSKLLGLVISQADRVKVGDEASFLGTSSRATDAILRRSELASWRQAALGEEVTVSFAGMLEAFMLTRRFTRAEDSRMSLLEFAPVLLGARALEAGQSSGYVGRLSLLREGKRTGVDIATDGNRNWDFGVFLGPTVTDFDQPTSKIEVKNSAGPRKAGARPGNYRRGGIIRIVAQDYDLHKTRLIRKVCSAELEAARNPGGTGSPPKGAWRLDRSTAMLHKRYAEPVMVKD